MSYTDETLGANESSERFMIVGSCDAWIMGLTSGAVNIEVKFPGSSTWTTMPGGSFTEDTLKTIYMSEHGVYFRFTGVSNNAGVYVRFARYKN